MSEHGIHIRPMTPADIPLGMSFVELAGWNQPVGDWRRFVELEPKGCFVVAADGGDCGTTATIAYGKRFGWIGMVIVHPDKRRRGIGRRLLVRAIDYLQGKGVETVKLDATPQGKQLYDTLGFEDEYIVRRWAGIAKACATDNSGARPINDKDLARVAAFDATAFGADRREVIRCLATENPGHSLLLDAPDGTVRAYAIARPGRNAWTNL